MNGQRIKYFRELHNHKREWLADKLNINVTQVSRIENNQSKLTVDRLYQIAKLFNVSIFDLFEAEYIGPMDTASFEKYGPVESSFIRYLIRQNEMQEAKYEALVAMNEQLMRDLAAISNTFRQIMDHLHQQNKQLEKMRQDERKAAELREKKAD